MRSNFSDTKPEFCPECKMKLGQEVTLVYKAGGFTKEGKQYNAFYGCPNFKDAEIKCQFTWRPARTFERKNGNGTKPIQQEEAKKIFAEEVLRRLDELKAELVIIKELLNK